MGEFMNELNYASLEASKKLVDNGIVLETEMYWGCQTGTGTPIWKLQLKNCHFLHCEGEDYPEYPAPCFTDVWRELEKNTIFYGADLYFSFNLSEFGFYTNSAKFSDGLGRINSPTFMSDNPTDALIDLLIWVREQNKDRIVNKLLDRADKLKW